MDDWKLPLVSDPCVPFQCSLIQKTRYLKQEISASSKSSEPVHFTSVEWHAEKALQMILTTSCESKASPGSLELSDISVAKVIYRTYAWDTAISPSKPPIDSGLVSVADGCEYFLAYPESHTNGQT